MLMLKNLRFQRILDIMFGDKLCSACIYSFTFIDSLTLLQQGRHKATCALTPLSQGNLSSRGRILEGGRGKLGVTFRNQRIFFSYFPIQSGSVTLFTFYYVPFGIRAVPLLAVLVTALNLTAQGWCSSVGGKENSIAMFLFLLGDVRGNGYIWLIFLAQLFIL